MMAAREVLWPKMRKVSNTLNTVVRLLKRIMLEKNISVKWKVV